MFDRTIEAIDRKFPDQPVIQARLLQTMASTMKRLGLLHPATNPQMRALSIRRAELGTSHTDTLHSINYAGQLPQAQGDPAAAETLFHEAIETHRRLYGDEHPNTLSFVHNLGSALVD